MLKEYVLIKEYAGKYEVSINKYQKVFFKIHWKFNIFQKFVFGISKSRLLLLKLNQKSKISWCIPHFKFVMKMKIDSIRE